MDRRRFVATATALGGAALAGCLGGGGDDTPNDTPTMRTTDFSIRRIESGVETDAATVSFADDSVTVEGTIWGADGCTTAGLAGADYEDGELRVAVATTSEATDGDVACTQAVVEIDYRATVTFEHGLPDRVVVTHRRGSSSVEVTTARP